MRRPRSSKILPLHVLQKSVACVQLRTLDDQIDQLLQDLTELWPRLQPDLLQLPPSDRQPTRVEHRAREQDTVRGAPTLEQITWLLTGLRTRPPEREPEPEQIVYQIRPHVAQPAPDPGRR